MSDDKKQKLIDLGADVLADVIISLSNQNELVSAKVDQLTSTPKENVQRFKRKLAGLKRSRRFIRWKDTAEFSRFLEMMLEILEASPIDPTDGLELIKKFYETDSSVFNRCDDSSGQIGNVYRFDAQRMFKRFAILCQDKEKVAEIILALSLENDYGVRDTVIDCASECLPESNIRSMIHRIQDKAKKDMPEYQSRSLLLLIESLAHQIKDAKLFEQTRRISWGTLNSASYLDIARVYFDAGEVEIALSFVDKMPENETFTAYERNKLLEEIYRQQGDKDKLTELLHHKLREHHSLDNLDDLLDIIGHENGEKIILAEMSLIMNNPTFTQQDVVFLLDLKKIDEAEQYIIHRFEQISGDYYSGLLSLAKAMTDEKRPLAATLLYRPLLVSILERAYTKAYSYGIRYLTVLDTLANDITDWENTPNHKVFKNKLLLKHGRKKSFWSKYKGACVS